MIITWTVYILVEVGLGDGNEVGVDCGHDGDEGRLSREGRENATELTRSGNIEEVLGGGREGGREGGGEGEGRREGGREGEERKERGREGGREGEERKERGREGERERGREGGMRV